MDNNSLKKFLIKINQIKITLKDRRIQLQAMSSSESLRGYGQKQFEHDRWKCGYCGLDCSEFELWLLLCIDHIIPVQQQNEVNVDLDDKRNYITSCRMCNSLANKTKFVLPKEVTFEQQVAAVLKQKRAAKLKRREEFREYWSTNVKPKLMPEK